MRTELFDFELPDDRIALGPVRPRDAARMLVVRPGKAFEDRVVRELPQLLNPGDALVVNDTRVIPAALDGVRRRGDGPVAKVARFFPSDRAASPLFQKPSRLRQA